MNNAVKLGICDVSLPAEGADKIRMCRNLGFSGIVVDFGNPDAPGSLADDAVLQAYKAQSQKHNVAMETMTVNVLCTVGMSHAGNYDAITKILDSAVIAAQKLGIKIISLPSFGNGAVKSDAHRLSTAKCLKYLCRKTSALSIITASENVLSVADNIKLIS